MEKSAQDLRYRPVYSAAEAARYLRLPVSTVRAWAFGQRAPSTAAHFHSVITPADGQRRRLSFVNLVELLVLGAIRRKHRVSLPQVRSAVRFLEKHFPSPHPL